MQKYPQKTKMIDMEIIQRYVLLSEEEKQRIAASVRDTRERLMQMIHEITEWLYDIF